MKFYKRQNLSKNDPMDNAFAVESDGRIVTNTKRSLQIPVGNQANRPTFASNGQIRYNTNLQDTELYNISGRGTGWEKIKTNRQSVITAQNLGNGNYSNNYFGPLSYNVDIQAPQNVLVFVDNVYQIPTTNYTLSQTNGITATTFTVGFTAFNSNNISITTTTNIGVGQLVTGTGILPGTTVTNVDSVSNILSIDPPTNSSLSDGTLLTFNYPVGGVLIQFSSPPPAKPVFALLGFDGYSPPNS